MRIAPLALAFLLGACSEDGPFAAIDCPFDLPATHDADCARFTRMEGEVAIAFDTALLTPKDGAGDGHLLYLPGGPGEAPVSKDGPPPTLMENAGDRPILLFNPRGTAGTEPRMECTFGDVIWSEDFADDDARDSLAACRAGIAEDGIDPALFSSRAIADDVDALVRARGVERAGVWGISYGTEAGLHLLDAGPDWLDFAILDSVSLPGHSGVHEFRAARDRFLELVDRLCFGARGCKRDALDGADTLTEWAARFDDAPLRLAPREGVTWDFDSVDVLDWLAELGGYPDGADVALYVIEGLQTSREETVGFMNAVIADNVAFAVAALPLMMEAYSDTAREEDAAALREPGLYPTDAETALAGLAFQRLWHAGRPMEASFLPDSADPAPVPARTLVLAGGVDPLTPAEWAFLLDRRFTGLERHLFPLLGHAVSVGYPSGTSDPAIARQLACAGEVVRAFLDPTSTLDDTCATYAEEKNG